MQYLPRLDKDPYGIVAGYQFYVSQSTTDWGSAVAMGTFGADRSAKRVDFPEKTGRYIRFVSRSEISGSALSSMAELDVVGALERRCPRSMVPHGRKIDDAIVPLPWGRSQQRCSRFSAIPRVPPPAKFC
jgi:hypothetical protein